jgi:branched-chain amino acid transport system ATP-binding protein
MQQGQVLAEGKPDVIRSDERVRRAYLGSMITGGRA